MSNKHASERGKCSTNLVVEIVIGSWSLKTKISICWAAGVRRKVPCLQRTCIMYVFRGLVVADADETERANLTTSSMHGERVRRTASAQ